MPANQSKRDSQYPLRISLPEAISIDKNGLPNCPKWTAFPRKGEDADAHAIASVWAASDTIHPSVNLTKCSHKDIRGPMTSDVRTRTAVIQRIHDSETKAVVSVAGAGTAAISWLLGVAGASRTVLEITVPYASSALVDFVGSEPAQFVSEETALAMARAAYNRALLLREGSEPAVGIACTATIATDRPKRGDHRCHIAAWSGNGHRTYSLTFIKGLRDRSAEDEIASKLVLRALAEASDVDFDAHLRLDPGERVQTSTLQFTDAIEALMAGHIGKAVVHGDGRQIADETFRGVVLSGSFNPLHDGHESLAKAASKIVGSPVSYEISVTNVDKPPLSDDEIRRRLTQFSEDDTVILTRATVFYKKADLLPGCTFVIGVDTAERLFDPLYYDGSMGRMLHAMQRLQQNECRFLVAGRLDGEVFRTLSDIRVPDGFEHMFKEIPESDFRMDISSTELRQTRGAVST